LQNGAVFRAALADMATAIFYEMDFPPHSVNAGRIHPPIIWLKYW